MGEVVDDRGTPNLRVQYFSHSFPEKKQENSTYAELIFQLS
jgi:hypothetical protein